MLKVKILITNGIISSILKYLPVNIINAEPMQYNVMVCFLIDKNTVMPYFGHILHLSNDSQIITVYF